MTPYIVNRFLSLVLAVYPTKTSATFTGGAFSIVLISKSLVLSGDALNF